MLDFGLLLIHVTSYYPKLEIMNITVCFSLSLHHGAHAVVGFICVWTSVTYVFLSQIKMLSVCSVR